jgi:hypothetical protein
VQLKNSSAWKSFATLAGPVGNISFTSDTSTNSPYLLTSGTYQYYTTSTTSGGTMYYPSCAANGSCSNGNGNNAYLSFQLK